MPSFVKKLASKAAKKFVNKTVDKLVDGIFGSRTSGPGRVFTFGGMERDMRFAPNPDLLQYRTFFHDQLTREWSFQTPNRSLWYLEIDKFPVQVIDTSSMKQFELLTVNNRTPDTNSYNDNYSAYNHIVAPNSKTGSPNSILQKNTKGDQNTGCLFAQGVSIPQESMAITSVDIAAQSGGFIRGLIANPRAAFEPLSIEFRETNVSFVDTVLRPWVIAASHLGLVSRPSDDINNIKADITITQLGVFRRDVPPVIRKQFRFFNCVPVQINRQQMTYDVDSGSMNPIDTQWHYSHYVVKIDPQAQTSIPSDAEDGSIMGGFGDPRFDVPSAGDLAREAAGRFLS